MEYIEFTELIPPHIKKILERLKKAIGEIQNGKIPEDGNRGMSTEQWYKAIEKQFVFSPEEKKVFPWELTDPLGAHRYQKTSRLVHQYKNRALILTTARCFGFCRFCFRRAFTGGSTGWISQEETDQACRYISAHPEIQEVLLTGGDPLTASLSQLEKLFSELRKANSSVLIRVGTRAPVFNPGIFTEDLFSLLQSFKPLWLIPHINHPAEISRIYSPETYGVLDTAINRGIPVQSQTVLLKGVNDAVDVLHCLFHELTCIGVKPGYLFQCDMVPGTSHLRVPVEEGFLLYQNLKKELSGLSTPVYAVDLPGGGGKFNLLQLNPEMQEIKVTANKEFYVFQKADGSQWQYPKH